METFMPLIVAALLIEAIINLIESVKDSETSWKYWASLIGGIGLGVLVAFNWDIDLFEMAGLLDGKIPILGALLTGLILSRGSNVVSDIIGLISVPKLKSLVTKQ